MSQINFGLDSKISKGIPNNNNFKKIGNNKDYNDDNINHDDSDNDIGNHNNENKKKDVNYICMII